MAAVDFDIAGRHPNDEHLPRRQPRLCGRWALRLPGFAAGHLSLVGFEISVDVDSRLDRLCADFLQPVDARQLLQDNVVGHAPHVARACRQYVRPGKVRFGACDVCSR